VSEWNSSFLIRTMFAETCCLTRQNAEVQLSNICKHSVPTAKKIQLVTITKNSWSIIYLCWENHNRRRTTDLSHFSCLGIGWHWTRLSPPLVSTRVVPYLRHLIVPKKLFEFFFVVIEVWSLWVFAATSGEFLFAESVPFYFNFIFLSSAIL
jgi:hypothetical protein